jgi:energy-coupling factor transporter transmembrane protein EcfT
LAQAALNKAKEKSMGWLDDIEKKRIEEEKKWNAFTISHKAGDGTDVNAYGYDRNGNKHYGNYQEPQKKVENNSQGTYRSSSSSSVSDADTIMVFLGIILIALIVLVVFVLKKTFAFVKANLVFSVIILAIAVACIVVCSAIRKKSEKKALKTFLAIFASAAMIGALIYIGPAKITGYFNGLKQDSALLETSAQTPATLTFPRTGTWDLTGQDSKNWTANMVIYEMDNKGFSGYFEWNGGIDQSGREYFRGDYDPQTRKVVIQGTRLHNARGIALGKYEAFLNGDNNFESGTMNNGGVWEAIWQNGTSASTQPSVPAASPSAPEQTSATLIFPRTGTLTLRLTGRDRVNWTAKMVIDEIDANGFSGYFEWNGGIDHCGREYFEGVYDPRTRKAVIQGTSLSDNSRGIALSKYEAFLTEDNFDFKSGTWTGDGVWEAIWQN